MRHYLFFCILIVDSFYNISLLPTAQLLDFSLKLLKNVGVFDRRSDRIKLPVGYLGHGTSKNFSRPRFGESLHDAISLKLATAPSGHSMVLLFLVMKNPTRRNDTTVDSDGVTALPCFHDGIIDEQRADSCC